MTSPLVVELKKLNKRVWTTRGARFAGCSRLDLQHRSTEVGTVVLAIITLVIPVALILGVFPTSSYNRTVASFLSIVSSASIIGMRALVRQGANDYRRALDASARELGGLLDQIDTLIAAAESDPSTDVLAKLPPLKLRYKSILDKYPENHRVIDYERFRAQNSTELGIGPWKALSINARWYLFPTLPVLTPVLVVLVVWFLLPDRVDSQAEAVTDMEAPVLDVEVGSDTATESEVPTLDVEVGSVR